MTEAENEREEILKFLQAWDAEQSATHVPTGEIPDDPDPVVCALKFFPAVVLH